MSVRVEPQEVLAYLNRMGFCHISADQLRAFIKDLKKLIKHDLRECKCARVGSPNVSCTTTNDSDTCFYDSSTCYCEKENGSSSDQDETDYSCTSTEKSEHEKENAMHTGEMHTRSKQSKIQKIVDRPRSSFIKPWQLQAPATHRRTDPVALYHKYQSMWQQQKVPGDDGRIGLRWHVREKMLGVDPHPRPVPRAPSMERIAKHKPGCSSLRLT